MLNKSGGETSNKASPPGAVIFKVGCFARPWQIHAVLAGKPREKRERERGEKPVLTPSTASSK